MKKSFRELFVAPEYQILPLDGIRAVAILLVVGLHSNNAILRAGLEPALFSNLPPFRGGWVGVPLFFVLSGFFIGTQVWKEWKRTSSVQVLRFVFRRGMRIWPLYYVVFLVSYFLFPENAENFWSNLLFGANYFGDAGPIRGSWSLSTEEQFYFLFPGLIFLTSRFFNVKSLASYRRLLLVVLLIPPISRALTWYLVTGFQFYDVNLYMNWIYRPLHTNFDGLIVGLLISNVIADQSIKLKPFWHKYVSLTLVISALMLTLTFLQKVVFFYSALALIFGSVVWMALNHKNILTRILSYRGFYFIAKTSYATYLIHHLVIWSLEGKGWFSKTRINPEFHLLSTFFMVLVISCSLSCLAYVFIESPFLKIRNALLKDRVIENKKVSIEAA